MTARDGQRARVYAAEAFVRTLFDRAAQHNSRAVDFFRHPVNLRLLHDGGTVMFLAEQFRYSVLGLTDEASLFLHELPEFGLIVVTDSMPNRKRGRIQLGETGGKPSEL